jgi:hypothetical protein
MSANSLYHRNFLLGCVDNEVAMVASVVEGVQVTLVEGLVGGSHQHWLLQVGLADLSVQLLGFLNFFP